MNKLIILNCFLLFISCFSNETQEIADDSPILLDTLFFNKNMDGALLIEKFKIGKQAFNDYKIFLAPSKIDTLQIIQKEHSKTEIKYLGTLKDLNLKTTYHIITKFKIIGIGKMLSPRGRSEVIFIDFENEKTIIYDLGMPENLPTKIENNILYFQSNGLKFGVSISGGLSPLLCLPEIGCN